MFCLFESVERRPASRLPRKEMNVLTFGSTQAKVVSVETTSRKPDSISGLEAHLGYWMRRVSNHVSGTFVRALKQVETSAAEWVFVRELYERTEATPGEMAEAVGMTRGAVSKIVDKLEAKGWVRASGSPSDGRVQVLSLTRTGQRAVPGLARIADENDEEFFGCLSANERDALRRLLVKLADCNGIREVPVE